MKNYIKRLLFIVLSMILCISAFSGCNKASDNYAFFSSYMVNSQDRDVPDDDMIEEKLLPSEALCHTRDYERGESQSEGAHRDLYGRYTAVLSEKRFAQGYCSGY